MNNLLKPRGTRDLLPQDQAFWDKVRNTASQKAFSFNFEKIDLPTFENEKLFRRSIGADTDVIEKELFGVQKISKKEDKDDEKVEYALRPEGTAGVVRSYLENGMASLSQPVKLWYMGSMFRYDRPQKGRFREFQSMGAELIGDDSPASDALMILMAWEIVCALGLEKDIIIDINSIGDKECRPNIKKSIISYFKEYKNDLCTDCRSRLSKNPLRLLDCKNSNCLKIQTKLPQTIDLLDENCRNHFKQVLEYIEDLDIPYDLNPKLVRGLDYYTRTTFELRTRDDSRRQNVIGGGGRYDYLIEQLGGKPTPAVGFALGLDRIVDLLKEKNSSIEREREIPDFCVVQLGEKARQFSLVLIKQITRYNLSVSIAPGKDSLKSQLRLANKLGCKYALIIGQREVFDKSVIIKNLDEGTQETQTLKKFEKYLEKYAQKKFQ